MTKELKPCPFCGSNSVSVHMSRKGDFYVKCEDCECHSASWKKKTFVIDAWNRRVQP